MKTIYKYEIYGFNSQIINMPIDSKVLHVGAQNERIFIWVEIEDSKKCEARVFSAFGTGQELLGEDNVFIGTVLIPPFVWHIYER